MALPLCYSHHGLAPPEGFEPPTPTFVAWYSIPLSYGGIVGAAPRYRTAFSCSSDKREDLLHQNSILVLIDGIEPSASFLPRKRSTPDLYQRYGRRYRIRTYVYRNQNPGPYHLANLQLFGTRCRIRTCDQQIIGLLLYQLS